MTTHPAIATFAEFARILGVSRGWVTQIKQDGRLVLTPDGKLVQVAESIARIEATRDPAKDAVAARHAAGRAGRGEQGAPAPLLPALPVEAPAPLAAPPAADDSADDEPAEGVIEPPPSRASGEGGSRQPRKTSGLAYWRSKREEELYRATVRENALAEGKLLERARVIQACDVAIATLNARLSAWREQLAPQVPGIQDEQAARAILSEATEQMSEQFARDLAKAVEHNT